MNKQYIYALIDENGVLFYIGRTKNFHKRYALHVRLDAGIRTATYYRIKDILERGFYPEITILFHLEVEDAIKTEERIITALTKSGYKLTNSQFNYSQWNKNRCSVKDAKCLKDAIKAVKYRFEFDQYFSNNKDENGKQIRFKLPNPPF